MERARLLREARTASQLNHPNICTVYEVGEAGGQAYFAVEFVEGQPLSARLATGAFPPEQVLRYGQQLADALAHAHPRGVIHRDLKSANVLAHTKGKSLCQGAVHVDITSPFAGLEKRSGRERAIEELRSTLRAATYLASEDLDGLVPPRIWVCRDGRRSGSLAPVRLHPGELNDLPRMLPANDDITNDAPRR